MKDTILIKVTNHKALRLLEELENLHLIKVIKRNLSPSKTKLSDKYRGVFTKEDAKSFEEHTQTIRNEWNDV